jgi:hypothetical protein
MGIVEDGRLNPNAIQRDELFYTLGRRDLVMQARRKNSCLLCSGTSVNAAGLCDSCMPFLSSEERDRVDRWMVGMGP